MSVLLAKRLISAREYYKMAEVGILKSEDNLELINGEIIEMSPIGSKHPAYIDLLDELLKDLLGKRVQVRVQSSVRLDNYSEPEPDIMVLKRRKDFYFNRIPTPKDVYLVIEVADSTLEKDRKIKVPLYAKAGIPEYWILNIPDSQLECYSLPKSGKYQKETIVKNNQNIIFYAFDLSIKATTIFTLSNL